MISEKHMTYDEILASYRDAKDKKSQVEILSQLNLCSKDDILEVLRYKGLTYHQLPRYTSNKKKEKQEVKSKEGISRDDVLHYLDTLREKRVALKEQIDEIDREYQLIQQKIIAGTHS